MKIKFDPRNGNRVLLLTNYAFILIQWFISNIPSISVIEYCKILFQLLKQFGILRNFSDPQSSAEPTTNK